MATPLKELQVNEDGGMYGGMIASTSSTLDTLSVRVEVDKEFALGLFKQLRTLMEHIYPQPEIEDYIKYKIGFVSHVRSRAFLGNIEDLRETSQSLIREANKKNSSDPAMAGAMTVMSGYLMMEYIAAISPEHQSSAQNLIYSKLDAFLMDAADHGSPHAKPITP